MELQVKSNTEVLDRLQEERTELILKSHKLRQFLVEPSAEINGKQLQLLRVQLNIMMQYIQVLSERIGLMQGEPNG